MPEDKIIQKLLEHDKRLDQIEERVEKTLTLDDYLKGQDKILAVLQRLDQERVFTSEWIRRIESDVERVKKELKIT